MIAPTATWRASRSGTKLRPLMPGTVTAARARARAAPGLSLTRTSPDPRGSTLNVRPSFGGGRSDSTAGIAKGKTAGVGSNLPPGPRARTANVWRPADSALEVENGDEQGAYGPLSIEHSKLAP